jgi:molecular chaperone DnaK
VERQLKDLGDKIPVHEKARAQQLLDDLKTALKESSTSIERIRSLQSDLQQAAYSISQTAYGQSGSAPGGTGAPGGSGTAPHGGDDVVDAEYEEK